MQQSLMKLKISLIQETKLRVVRNSSKSAAECLQISPEVRPNLFGFGHFLLTTKLNTRSASLNFVLRRIE
jgi:hypothetical protein